MFVANIVRKSNNFIIGFVLLNIYCHCLRRDVNIIFPLFPVIIRPFLIINLFFCSFKKLKKLLLDFFWISHLSDPLLKHEFAIPIVLAVLPQCSFQRKLCKQIFIQLINRQDLVKKHKSCMFLWRVLWLHQYIRRTLWSLRENRFNLTEFLRFDYDLENWECNEKATMKSALSQKRDSWTINMKISCYAKQNSRAESPFIWHDTSTELHWTVK